MAARSNPVANPMSSNRSEKMRVLLGDERGWPGGAEGAGARSCCPAEDAGEGAMAWPASVGEPGCFVLLKANRISLHLCKTLYAFPNRAEN
jgi:hypothetical protein